MIPEFELIAAIRPLLDGDGPRAPVGVDDDAAVVLVDGTPVVLAVDTMVDGVHVDRSWSSDADFGWKALAVNLSDLAAMAALPVAAVVSLQRPEDLTRDEVLGLYRGLREAADRYDCLLIGGDVVGSPTYVVSVSILGRPAREGVMLRRDGARAGDEVVVAGEVGLAAAALACWQEGATDLLDAHPELGEAHRRPVPRLDAVPALAETVPSAAIDVSDGLGRDLGHLAAASGVAIDLDPDALEAAPGVDAAAEHLGRDPLDFVLAGGDDYALASTVPADRTRDLLDALADLDVPARIVGTVRSGEGVEIAGRDISTSGWEHA